MERDWRGKQKGDFEDQVLWQLNQIRIATTVTGALVAAAALGLLALVFLGSTSV